MGSNVTCSSSDEDVLGHSECGVNKGEQNDKVWWAWGAIIRGPI